MINRHPIVDELAASSTNPGMLRISFVTSVLRGLRRTLEVVKGAIDSTEVGPTRTTGRSSVSCFRGHARPTMKSMGTWPA